MDGISGDSEEERGRSEATIRFVVNGVDQLDDNPRYSAVTYIRHLPWKIRVLARDETTKYLSVYLNIQSIESMSNNWWCNAKVEVILVAQSATGHNITRNFEHKFNEEESGRGFDQFIEFEDVLNDEKGFSKDNTIVVEAKVSANRPYGVIMPSNVTKILDSIEKKSNDLYPELDYFMAKPGVTNNVVFKVEGKPIPAVKELLAVKCHNFRSMFSPGFVESKAQEVEVPDATYGAFKVIVWYLYSNELAIDLAEETDFQLIYDVFSVAHKQQIKRLLDYYENRLKANITEENLELVSRIAFDYEINSLMTCVKAFIDQIFDKLILGDNDYVNEMNGFTDGYVLNRVKDSITMFQLETVSGKFGTYETKFKYMDVTADGLRLRDIAANSGGQSQLKHTLLIPYEGMANLFIYYTDGDVTPNSVKVKLQPHIKAINTIRDSLRLGDTSPNNYRFYTNYELDLNEILIKLEKPMTEEETENLFKYCRTRNNSCHCLPMTSGVDIRDYGLY